MFALFCLVFVALGILSVAVMDDFWHASFIVKNHSFFTAPFYWTYGQYFHWTGRVVSSFLQGFLTNDPLRTNLVSAANALFFLFFLIAYFYSVAKKLGQDKETILCLSIIQISIACFFCYSVLGEAVYWAANVYVFPLICFLIADYLFENDRLSILKVYLFVIFFSLGNANELLILPTCYLFYENRKKNNLLWPLIFFIAGIATNLFSPGIYGHLKTGGHSLAINPTLQLENAFFVFKKGFQFLTSKAPYGFLLALVVSFSHRIELKKIKYQIKKNLIIAALSLLILIPLYGFSSNRTYIYFLIFFSIAFFWAVQFIQLKYLKLEFTKAMMEVCCLIGLVVLSTFWIVNVFDARSLRLSFLLQQEQLRTLAERSKNVSTFKMPLPMKDQILFYSDLSTDPNHWSNRAQAKFYDVESITAN